MAPSTLRRLSGLQPACFERLASTILRAHSPYESLIPTGPNEKGRAVASPVDGVCWIPGTSPPQGVLFAHTSCDRRRLEEKWLFNSSQAPRRKTKTEPGDVVKALRQAEEIRRQIPQAVLTLVLACTVDPGEAVVTKVRALCHTTSVEVDFWTASRLVDYLDRDPRGQWLRKEFLGIPSCLVSWDLLRELSEESCRSFAASIFEDTAMLHIERELDRRLQAEARQGGGVCFLVADSGTGKSSSGLALLRGHCAAGGCGLWLMPEDVATGGSLEGSVEAALRRLRPDLLPGCGAEALRLAVSHQGLLLVVDDASRAVSPPSLLTRLAAWAGLWEGDEGSGRRSRGWFLLCPIWPRFLSQLPETADKAIQALCLFGGPYTPEEGAAVLRARSQSCGKPLTDLEAHRLSEALGHDPLLLGLIDPRQIWEATGERPVILGIIEGFIERQLARLAQGGGQRFAVSDYEDALLDLADRMLLERELAPTWRTIRSWFPPSSGCGLDALRQISTDRQVAHVLREGREEVLHFRHDRVQDAILAAAVARSMKAGTLSEEILGEPFYAELMGQALLAPEIAPAWTNRLRESSPLALFRALQLIGMPRGPLQEDVITALKRWLAEEVITGRALEALQWEAARFLAETESPLVLELSRSFPETWHSILQARFRNGDVAAAIAYCADMWLGLPYGGFVPLVEHVKARLRNSFMPRLASMLNQSGLPKKQLRGALLLAGHLSDPVLAPAIRDSWEGAADDRLDLLAEFIWAALRCLPETENEAHSLLNPICELWQSLPDKNPDPSRPPENTEVIDSLGDAVFRRGLGSRAIAALIRTATGRLEWPITLLLSHIDATEAVEFTVRQAAAIKGYWSYTSAWEHWDFHKIRLSPTSILRLESLWRASEETGEVRAKAFHFWCITAEGAGLDLLDGLRDVGPSEPFYRQALQYRIRRGDRTAGSEMIRMVETDEFPHYWWHNAYRIWDATLRDALDSFLSRLDEDGRGRDWKWEGHQFCASEVLVEIPAAEAERLIIKHWERLRFRSIFVQTALAVATPRCCELVAEAVSDCPDPQRLLKHFEHHSGVWVAGRGQHFGSRQLEAILPYLDLFSGYTLEKLWWFCNEQHQFNYRRAHLDHRLTSEEKRHCQLGRESIFKELDRFLGEQWSPWSVDHLIDRSKKQGESWNELLQVLLDWLRERRTPRAFDVIAHALIWAGSRADLDRLRQVEIDADPVEIRKILDRTTFQVCRRRLL